MADQEIYRLLVALARQLTMRGMTDEPKPGDLVVEATGWQRPVDPDAIGWLIGHGPAPYGEDDPTDGSAAMRHVWDIVPLNPDAKLQTIGGRELQRWENATFYKVDQHILDRAAFIIEAAEV